MRTERRERRCSDPVTALLFYFEAECERRGAKAMVLGTFDGRALCGTGELPSDAVATAASLRLFGLATDEPGTFRDDPFVMSVIELRGERLLLTVVGGEDRPGMSEPHVERILRAA